MSKALFNTSGPAENLQWPIAERNVAREFIRKMPHTFKPASTKAPIKVRV
jgi:hypothetical protein